MLGTEIFKHTITPHIIGSALSGEPTVPHRALPHAMSLRLLNSEDRPIVSQLAPFAKSYDVSQIHSVSSVCGT